MSCSCTGVGRRGAQATARDWSWVTPSWRSATATDTVASAHSSGGASNPLSFLRDAPSRSSPAALMSWAPFVRRQRLQRLSRGSPRRCGRGGRRHNYRRGTRLLTQRARGIRRWFASASSHSPRLSSSCPPDQRVAVLGHRTILASRPPPANVSLITSSARVGACRAAMGVDSHGIWREPSDTRTSAPSTAC